MSDARSPRPEGASKTIEIAKERLKVEKREVERTAAIIRLRTTEENVPVHETLRREYVDIERRPVDLVVDTPPETREEVDVTIIPIVEEVLVRRFHVIEELHVRRRRETIEVDETVTLRRRDVYIDTEGADPGASNSRNSND